MSSPLQLISSSPGHPARKRSSRQMTGFTLFPARMHRRNKKMGNLQGPSGFPYLYPICHACCVHTGPADNSLGRMYCLPQQETLFSQKHNQPPTTHPGLAAEGSYILSSIFLYSIFYILIFLFYILIFYLLLSKTWERH